MSRKRLVLFVVALLLVAFSWIQLAAARNGLVVRRLDRDGLPLLYVAPQGAIDAPGVLVAHGFAGSKQLMLGYAYTLAHAGYAVMLWDFDGHGANARALQRDALQDNVDLAAAVLREQPEVDDARLALLGHSMGSGAAMTAAIRGRDVYRAVVAISPTGADVSPASPANLLLQAGSLEGRFVANAEGLLARAGGPNNDFPAGGARALIVVPFAEHITILFRTESHRAALDWLNRSFGLPPVLTATGAGPLSAAVTYTDRRILWYALHLLAIMLLVLTQGNVWRSGLAPETRVPALRRWLGLAAGPIVATLLLGLAGRFLPIGGFLGLQVGGVVALWLALAGTVWLLFLRPLTPPALSGVVLGVVLFVFLSLAFGVMAQSVWVQWWLNGARLLRWPVLVLLCLPWFLAVGYATWGARPGQRLAWWFGQSVIVLAGMLALLMVVPSLGFLLLIIPVFPLILAMLGIAATVFDRPWPFAIGSALFFGWVLAAVFPLA